MTLIPSRKSCAPMSPHRVLGFFGVVEMEMACSLVAGRAKKRSSRRQRLGLLEPKRPPKLLKGFTFQQGKSGSLSQRTDRARADCRAKPANSQISLSSTRSRSSMSAEIIDLRKRDVDPPCDLPPVGGPPEGWDWDNEAMVAEYFKNGPLRAGSAEPPPE